MFARTQYACMPCGVFDAAVALYALQKCSLLQRSWITLQCGWAGLMLKLCVGCHIKRTPWIGCLVPVFSCRIVLIKRHYSTRAHCSESYNYYLKCATHTKSVHKLYITIQSDALRPLLAKKCRCGPSSKLYHMYKRHIHAPWSSKRS